MTHAHLRAHPLDAARLSIRICAVAVAGLLLLGLANPAAAAASASTKEKRHSVLYYTNKARKANGCDNALKMSRKLTESSQKHAADMNRKNYFGHTSMSGRSWDDRIRAAGYKQPGGENIAWGYSSAKAVVKAWMDSPTHRRNILTCSFEKLGVGYAKGDGVWVQDFGY